MKYIFGTEIPWCPVVQGFKFNVNGFREIPIY